MAGYCCLGGVRLGGKGGRKEGREEDTGVREEVDEDRGSGGEGC